MCLRSKLDEIAVLSSRMKTGLLKLVEAEKSVNELSKELAVKEKDLAVASKEADEVISGCVLISNMISLTNWFG